MIRRVAAFIVALIGGCVHASAPIVVDQKTALEAQAAGSFRAVEDELTRAEVRPGPVPLSRSQIEASGAPSEPLALSQSEEEDDGDRVDDLLVRRCIGEAGDGTLVPTPQRCAGQVDEQALGLLLGRVNRSRWQVWRYLEQQRPQAGVAAIRRTWREVHLKSLVCGGQYQSDGGTWEIKPPC